MFKDIPPTIISHSLSALSYPGCSPSSTINSREVSPTTSPEHKEKNKATSLFREMFSLIVSVGRSGGNVLQAQRTGAAAAAGPALSHGE